MFPMLKFHINRNRIGKDISFQDDTPDAGYAAKFTTDQLSVLDTGMLGILRNGINTDIFKRIKEHRGQFIWGLAQLVTAVALTAFYIPGIIPDREIVTKAVEQVIITINC